VGAIAHTKKAEQDTPYPGFNPWMYSLDSFLPIINFGQKDYWSPEVPEFNPSPLSSQQLHTASAPSPLTITWVKFLRLYRWLHIAVGWLLIMLGIAGVTSLVRKE
jgi:hypothetical protein